MHTRPIDIRGLWEELQCLHLRPVVSQQCLHINYLTPTECYRVACADLLHEAIGAVQQVAIEAIIRNKNGPSNDVNL